MTELLMKPTEKLQQQQLHHHQQQQQQQQKPSKPGKVCHICNSCGSSFASSRNLERHQNRENGHCKLGADVGTIDASGSFSVFDIDRMPVAILASAAPFFINSFGRYQFNTNAMKHSINCPFCLVHRTSMQGLAKHCLVNHKQQYLAWKSGSYGKVQLRWIPPDDALIKKVLLVLKDVGLLERDIPLADSATLVPRTPTSQAKPTAGRGRPNIFYKKSKTQVKTFQTKSANWRKIRAAAAMETACASPPPFEPLPPPPPLVDCRSLTATADAVATLPSSAVSFDSTAPSDDNFRQKRHQKHRRNTYEGRCNPNYYYHREAFYNHRQPEQFLGHARYQPSYCPVGPWQSQPQPSSYNYAGSYQHHSVHFGDGQQSVFSPPAPLPPQQSSAMYGYDYQGDRTFRFRPPFDLQPQASLPPPDPPQQLFPPPNLPQASFPPPNPPQPPFPPPNLPQQPPQLAYHY